MAHPRGHVTQKKGDGAEGERTLRVFLLSEKRGDVKYSACLSLLHWDSPGAIHRSRDEELCFPRSPVNEIIVTLLGSLAHTLLPCASFVLQAHEVSFSALTERVLETDVRCSTKISSAPAFCDHHDVTAALLLRSNSVTCVLFHMKLQCSALILPKTFLEVQWHFSIKDRVRERIYSLLQQTQRKNKAFHVQSPRK